MTIKNRVISGISTYNKKNY